MSSYYSQTEYADADENDISTTQPRRQSASATTNGNREQSASISSSKSYEPFEISHGQSSTAGNGNSRSYSEDEDDNVYGETLFKSPLIPSSKQGVVTSTTTAETRRRNSSTDGRQSRSLITEGLVSPVIRQKSSDMVLLTPGHSKSAPPPTRRKSSDAVLSKISALPHESHSQPTSYNPHVNEQNCRPGEDHPSSSFDDESDDCVNQHSPLIARDDDSRKISALMNGGDGDPRKRLPSLDLETMPVTSALGAGNARQNQDMGGDGLFRNTDDPKSNAKEDQVIYSNERLLGTAFVSFMSFALVQLLFAFIAGSQAMMGDSAAMIVDALTYLFNWIAERNKNRFDEIYNATAYHNEAMISGITRSKKGRQLVATNNNAGEEEEKAYEETEEDIERYNRLRERAKRKMVLQLEIVPPFISVTTLIVVIGFVFNRAVRVLYLDMHRNRSQQKNPNVGLMLAFSVFNLGLDGLNVFCFAKAKHLFGYETDPRPDAYCKCEGQGLCTSEHCTYRPESEMNYDPNTGIKNSKIEMVPNGFNSTGHGPHSTFTPSSDGDRISALDDSLEDVTGNSSSDSEDQALEDHANLNMCSAYTHVFADTLRSIAVIVAALVAELLDEVTPEEADATAAVIVSVLILLSLIPLFKGLLQSLLEFRAILDEERSEITFKDIRRFSQPS